MSATSHSKSHRMPRHPPAAAVVIASTNRGKNTRQPLLVRYYTRLYAARFGLVSHPQPRGALSPSECRMYRFTEVRAAIRFFKDGLRKNPLAMVASPPAIPPFQTAPDTMRDMPI